MEAPQEVEGKWLVRNLQAVAEKITALGGELHSARVREQNLRFDTPDGKLQAAFEVLRLRQDEQARLTYKSPAKVEQGISQRTEIEFAVSDFALARQLLEALGYSVCFVYEKYRQEYVFADCTIMLDELPYGNFVEIEGPDAFAVQQAAQALGLKPELASLLSYSRLFEYYRSQWAEPARKPENLTFAAFAGIMVSPGQLGLEYADGGE